MHLKKQCSKKLLMKSILDKLQTTDPADNTEKVQSTDYSNDLPEKKKKKE